MEWIFYVLIGVWALWTLITTYLTMLYRHKLKQTYGRLYIGHNKAEEPSELYFEAYESPAGWKNEKQLLIDISYKEL